jgi:uncharacterized protein (DUF302 family)
MASPPLHVALSPACRLTPGHDGESASRWLCSQMLVANRDGGDLHGLSGGVTMATTGLTAVPSYPGPSETMIHLEAAINAAGMTVFARIDHGAAAAAPHLPLGPTELVIFGNAKGGTPSMQTNQAVGIDLPLKAVIYQDAAGKVWVAYNDPSWLVERHALGSEAVPIVAAMTSALKRIVARATGSAIP